MLGFIWADYKPKQSKPPANTLTINRAVVALGADVQFDSMVLRGTVPHIFLGAASSCTACFFLAFARAFFLLSVMGTRSSRAGQAPPAIAQR